ncbi:MAG: hypothetical protein EA397_13575 [Deltaproteobacteria bacterium]|nr:MAG: hypothetical protein EA397_13575 [Deltaproteobacteria bacterium]
MVETTPYHLLNPLGWYRRLFPDFDDDTVGVVFTACVARILYLYHGRPQHLATPFPAISKSIAPSNQRLAAFGYSHLAGIVIGKLARSGRSIGPTVLLHFGAAASTDFLTSSWWR